MTRMGPVMRSKWPKIIVASLIASALCALGWSFAGRLQDVPDAITKSARMHCVSYAPFRGNESPLDPNFHAPPERIEEDLTVLAKSFDCVRTYSTDQGIDAVLPAARKVGLKVLFGIWIGREAAGNDREIARAVQLAQAYRDVVIGVIVGNEVLLRGDQSMEQMRAHLDHVRQQIAPIPVTYADVWEFWLKNRDLAGSVDFVTVHMLPYWENQPIPVGEAVEHVTEALTTIAQAFPGKHILIGETGWPSKGRMREGAEPSLVAQATFIRGIISYTEAHDIETNLVEAFDTPWKRLNEGTVGGHWGIYDSNHHAKQTLTGPVSNHPDWRQKAAISSAIAVCLILLCFIGRRGVFWPNALSLAPLAALAGAMLCVTGGDLIEVRPTVTEISGAVLGMAIILGTALSVGRHWLNPSLLRGPILPDALLNQRNWINHIDLGDVMGLVRLGALIGAFAIALGLIFDPRYRDFPVEVYCVPAFAFAIESLWRPRWARNAAGPVESLLCTGVILSGALILALEGLSNGQAAGFATALILLGSRLGTAGRQAIAI